MVQAAPADDISMGIPRGEKAISADSRPPGELTFAELIKRDRRLIWWVINRFAGKAESADAWQEACIAVWIAQRVFKPEGKAQWKTYLTLAVKHRLWSRLYEQRYNKRKGTKVELKPWHHPKTEIDFDVSFVDAQKAIATLPAHQREVIERMAIGDQGSEIARDMGCSPQYVFQLRGRAVDKLRAAMQIGVET